MKTFLNLFKITSRVDNHPPQKTQKNGTDKKIGEIVSQNVEEDWGKIDTLIEGNGSKLSKKHKIEIINKLNFTEETKLLLNNEVNKGDSFSQNTFVNILATDPIFLSSLESKETITKVNELFSAVCKEYVKVDKSCLELDEKTIQKNLDSLRTMYADRLKNQLLSNKEEGKLLQTKASQTVQKAKSMINNREEFSKTKAAATQLNSSLLSNQASVNFAKQRNDIVNSQKTLRAASVVKEKQDSIKEKPLLNEIKPQIRENDKTDFEFLEKLTQEDLDEAFKDSDSDSEQIATPSQNKKQMPRELAIEKTSVVDPKAQPKKRIIRAKVYRPPKENKKVTEWNKSQTETLQVKKTKKKAAVVEIEEAKY